MTSQNVEPLLKSKTAIYSATTDDEETDENESDQEITTTANKYNNQAAAAVSDNEYELLGRQVGNRKKLVKPRTSMSFESRKPIARKSRKTFTRKSRNNKDIPLTPPTTPEPLEFKELQASTTNSHSQQVLKMHNEESSKLSLNTKTEEKEKEVQVKNEDMSLKTISILDDGTEKELKSVKSQAGQSCSDWLGRLEQLLIHFFLIIFDSSADFSKMMMEMYPVEANEQIEDIFRLLLQADPEMYKNIGNLVGLAENWLVLWHGQNERKKELLEYIRVYMIGSKSAQYYYLPVQERLQKLGSFIAGLKTLSPKNIDFEQLSLPTPNAIKTEDWTIRRPSPRVKPASHFANVVSNILCDRSCDEPFNRPSVYADSMTHKLVPSILHTESELANLTDYIYGSQYHKRDLFKLEGYKSLQLRENMLLDAANRKCCLPLHNSSYEKALEELYGTKNGKLDWKRCISYSGFTKRKSHRPESAEFQSEYEYEYEYELEPEYELEMEPEYDYELEPEYEYEMEPEYEYEYEPEYEIELDKKGNPILGPNGKPKLKLNADGKPIIKKDAAGNIIYKLDASGKPILRRDEKGNPIVKMDANGKPVLKRDAAGNIIYKVDAKGNPVLRRDAKGNPIVKMDAEGKPVVKRDAAGNIIYKLDSNGKPVIRKDEQGNPIVKLGPDGKPAFKRDADGNIIYKPKLDSDGKPILKLDSKGNPIVKKDANGKVIYKTDEFGRPVYKLGENGKPILKLGADGKPIVAYGPDGKPKLKLGDDGLPIIKRDKHGNPIYKRNEQGKLISQVGGSDRNAISGRSRSRPSQPSKSRPRQQRGPRRQFSLAGSESEDEITEKGSKKKKKAKEREKQQEEEHERAKHLEKKRTQGELKVKVKESELEKKRKELEAAGGKKKGVKSKATELSIEANKKVEDEKERWKREEKERQKKRERIFKNNAASAATKTAKTSKASLNVNTLLGLDNNNKPGIAGKGGVGGNTGPGGAKGAQQGANKTKSKSPAFNSPFNKFAKLSYAKTTMEADNNIPAPVQKKSKPKLKPYEALAGDFRRKSIKTYSSKGNKMLNSIKVPKQGHQDTMSASVGYVKVGEVGPIPLAISRRGGSGQILFNEYPGEYEEIIERMFSHGAIQQNNNNHNNHKGIKGRISINNNKGGHSHIIGGGGNIIGPAGDHVKIVHNLQTIHSNNNPSEKKIKHNVHTINSNNNTNKKKDAAVVDILKGIDLKHQEFGPIGDNKLPSLRTIINSNHVKKSNDQLAASSSKQIQNPITESTQEIKLHDKLSKTFMSKTEMVGPTSVRSLGKFTVISEEVIEHEEPPTPTGFVKKPEPHIRIENVESTIPSQRSKRTIFTNTNKNVDKLYNNKYKQQQKPAAKIGMKYSDYNNHNNSSSSKNYAAAAANQQSNFKYNQKSEMLAKNLQDSYQQQRNQNIIVASGVPHYPQRKHFLPPLIQPPPPILLPENNKKAVDATGDANEFFPLSKLDNIKYKDKNTIPSRSPSVQGYGDGQHNNNLDTISNWELAADLFRRPLKAIAIPPPENVLAYIEKKFPGNTWPKGPPVAIRNYPNGDIFCSTYRNGAGQVFYPHGGLAIIISSPSPFNHVLIIRDPYDEFYFLDKCLLADLDCSGAGVVYGKDGIVVMRYNTVGGYRLDSIEKTCHRWIWNRGGQRMILKMNRYMSLRVLDLTRIHVVFNGNKRGLRFNVGPGRNISLIYISSILDNNEALIPPNTAITYPDRFDYKRARLPTPVLGFLDRCRYPTEESSRPRSSELKFRYRLDDSDCDVQDIICLDCPT